MVERLPDDGPDTLHGWKDIATYLERSVRSAQRWEATLGLPIKRIFTPDGGQIVYASRVEIDEWLRHTAPGAEQDDPDADDPRALSASDSPIPIESDAEGVSASDASADPDTATWIRRVRATRGIRVGVSATIVATVLAIGILAGHWLTATVVPAWSTPAEYGIEGDAVQALTASGRLVWRYPLGQPAYVPSNIRVRPATIEGDLDGDGAHEIAVPVSFNSPRMLPQTTDMVVVFTRRGHVRWKIQPDVRLRKGDTVVGGAWRLFALAMSSAPPGRLWLAYAHHTTADTFVLEVSARGEQSIRYVTSGRFDALTHWRAATADYLIVGGLDRQQKLPSIAILDLNAPPARWPVDDDNPVTCDGCPSGSPQAMLLLPNSDVTAADFQPTGWVFQAHANGPDRLTADITNATGPVALDSAAVLTPDLTIAEIGWTEAHWATHREFEHLGRLDHTGDRCPDALRPRPVRRWTRASGWAEQIVTPAARPVLRLASDRPAR